MYAGAGSMRLPRPAALLAALVTGLLLACPAPGAAEHVQRDQMAKLKNKRGYFSEEELPRPRLSL